MIHMLPDNQRYNPTGSPTMQHPGTITSTTTRTVMKRSGNLGGSRKGGNAGGNLMAMAGAMRRNRKEIRAGGQVHGESAEANAADPRIHGDKAAQILGRAPRASAVMIKLKDRLDYEAKFASGYEEWKSYADPENEAPVNYAGEPKPSGANDEYKNQWLLYQRNVQRYLDTNEELQEELDFWLAKSGTISGYGEEEVVVTETMTQSNREVTAPVHHGTNRNTGATSGNTVGGPKFVSLKDPVGRVLAWQVNGCEPRHADGVIQNPECFVMVPTVDPKSLEGTPQTIEVSRTYGFKPNPLWIEGMATKRAYELTELKSYSQMEHAAVLGHLKDIYTERFENRHYQRDIAGQTGIYNAYNTVDESANPEGKLLGGKHFVKEPRTVTAEVYYRLESLYSGSKESPRGNQEDVPCVRHPLLNPWCDDVRPPQPDECWAAGLEFPCQYSEPDEAGVITVVGTPLTPDCYVDGHSGLPKCP